MHLDQRKYDEQPLKPFEKIAIIVLGSGFLAMLGVEVFSDFQPRKAGIFLFVLAWIPLLFIHEFGHAVMAKLLGWEVQRVSIGFGHKLMQTRFMGAPMEIRLIPLEGFVQTIPRNLHLARLKNALIYFAGPGVELAIFFGLLFWFGREWMFTVTDNYSTLALQAFAFAALIGAIINLIPIGIRTDDGVTANDGLGILQCLFADSRDYAKWIEENQQQKDSEPRL